MAIPDLADAAENMSSGFDDLAAAIGQTLRRDVVDVWFPRSVDRLRGGFNCDFDRRWRPRGPQRRLLEFQARQTRSAARLALAFPEDERFGESALHGLRFLRDVMWDKEEGGWYALVAPDGSPLAGATKHAHGTSYAVQACALVFEATGDDDARALAEEGFEWFDDRAHDDVHGGYHSWLTREGRVIRSAEEVPRGAEPVDPISGAIGLRDINVHGDWLEALNETHSILRTRGMFERLEELAGIFLDHFTTPHGEVFFGLRENWSPLPQPERFGYAFQAVERLTSAASKLTDGDRLRARAIAIGEHALRHGARRGGGYAFFAAVHAPPRVDGVSLVNRRRVWWVQLAALQALALLATTGDGRYRATLHDHWRFLEEQAIDPVYRGFYFVVPRDLGRRLRLRGRFGNLPELAKGTVWKDASHETDALLGTLGVVMGARDRTRFRRAFPGDEP